MKHLESYDIDVLASGPDPLEHELPAAELPEGWTLEELRHHLASCDPCREDLEAHRRFFAGLVVDQGSRVDDGALQERLARALAPSPWRVRPALAVAAALSAVLVGFWFLGRGPASSGTTATTTVADLATEYRELLSAVQEEDPDPLEARALALASWRQEGLDLGSRDDGEECLFSCSGLDGLMDLETEQIDELLEGLSAPQGG